jgi:hypothetical protein
VAFVLPVASVLLPPPPQAASSKAVPAVTSQWVQRGRPVKRPVNPPVKGSEVFMVGRVPFVVQESVQESMHGIFSHPN